MTLARAAAPSAVALILLAATAQARELNPFDRFYGSLGTSLSSFSNDQFGDQTTGWRSVHASIGRQFTPKTSLSLDVRLSDTATSTNHSGLPYQIEYAYRSLSLSLSGHRTLWQRGRLSISVGGGIGIDNGRNRQSYRLADGRTLFDANESHRHLQYNLTANVNWTLNGRLTLSMGNRRSWTVLEEGTWSQSMIDFAIRASVMPQQF